jgi:trigger factor
VEEVHYKPSEDLTFSISFDVRPVIELGRLGGFAVQKPDLVVRDEDVDRVLDRLRQQNGTWAPAEGGPPTMGDLASVSVLKLVDGQPDGDAQDYDLVLGEGEAIPDVENAILALEPGETQDFTASFPEDYPNEARRGEKQHLRITLRARKTRELPGLDDDFARTLGAFEDLDNLKNKIREDLEKEARDQSEMAVRGQLLQNILDANPLDVPTSMVERYIDSLLGDTSDADADMVARAREQIRPEATQAVRRILVIERVAETQDLRATEEELDERIEAVARKSDKSPSEVYASFQKTGRMEALEREITETKVFGFLKERSEIVPAKR